MPYNYTYELYIDVLTDKEPSGVGEDVKETIIKRLFEISVNASFVLKTDGKTKQSGGWDFEDDLRKLSKSYGGFLFTLHFEGEEGGDVARFYFFNGKMQKDQVVLRFEGFNPDKLK